MKKLLLFSTLILFDLTIAVGQITFQKTYPNLFVAFGPLAKAKDGGYLMVGTSFAGVAGASLNGSKVGVAKTDSSGVVQWVGTYGSNTDEQGGNIAPTKDGGYIVTGYYDNDINFERALLMKIGASGGLEWTKTYGIKNSSGWYNENGYYVLQTADKGYMVAGSTTAGFYLFKTDSMGTQQWTRVINNIFPNSIQPTLDGNYIILGITGTGSTSKTYLSKISLNDNIFWEKYITNPGGCNLNSVQETGDKGFIMSGSANNLACLIKTDSVGMYQWGNGYSGLNNLNIKSVIQSQDGGFAFAGGISKNILLGKTASDGSSQWTKAYGDTTIYTSIYPWTVLQNKDEGYTIGAFTDNGSPLNNDCYIVKTDSLGNSNCNEFTVNLTANTLTVTSTLCTTNIDTLGIDSILNFMGSTSSYNETVLCYQVAGINKVLQQKSINIYPNPNNGNFSIETNSTEKQTLQLFDITGRCVLMQIIEPTLNPFKERVIIVNASNLIDGVYNISFINNEGTANKRIVILR